MSHTFQANFSKWKLAFSRFSNIKSQQVFFLNFLSPSIPILKQSWAGVPPLRPQENCPESVPKIPMKLNSSKFDIKPLYFNLHDITTMEKPFIFFPLGIFVSLGSKFLMASSSLLFAMSIINMIQIIYKLNVTPFGFRGLVMGFLLWGEGLGKEARW